MSNGQPTDNIVESAISAGKALGTAKPNPNPHGLPYVVLPNGAIEYLERPDFPPRRSGTVKLNDDASFLEYWNRQADDASYIYGSLQPAQFVAVLNDHTADQPDWRDHRAILTLTHSKEWDTWLSMNRKPFDGNEAFAMWLEDNLVDIINPDPAKFMDIALNFKVQQGQNFAKAVNLDNGMIDLTYANTVEASAGAAKVQIPGTFTILIPVWSGLDAQPYEVTARFRFTLSGGLLKIRYELIRPHKTVEKAFKDCLAKIEESAKTKVLFGTPDA